MKITFDCYPCMIKSFLNMSKLFSISNEDTSRILQKILLHLSNINLNMSAPEIAKEMHKIIRKEMNNSDPYSEIKKHYNEKMLNLYDELNDKIKKSEKPFETALKLAIAGNIIDFGANNIIDIERTIDRVLSEKISINNINMLENDIRKAKTILYLGDNCGEIVMDKILIEYIKSEMNPDVRIYFSVRGYPILNDVTEDDAISVNMHQIATIINTNDDAPGVLLNNAKKEYLQIFDSVDLIISKGMGNYESLSEINRNIYFLLIAKCNLVSEHLNVKKGEVVICSLKK